MIFEWTFFVRTAMASLTLCGEIFDGQHLQVFEAQWLAGRHRQPVGRQDLGAYHRPLHEVLFPRAKPLEAVFENEFLGMSAQPVPLQALQAVRSRMLDELPRALPPRHRAFLLSMVRAEPDWSLLPHTHLPQLPALQWKLMNLADLRKNGRNFAMQHDELAVRFAAVL